jgi:hypothetical protein
MFTSSTARIARLLLVLVACGGTSMGWGAQQSGCVGTVADVYGTVTAANTASAKPQDHWPVQLMQCFAPGKVLQLAQAARATLFFPGVGTAFELNGPGKFEVMADAARALSGAASPVQTRMSDVFRQMQLGRVDLVPSGTRMREPFAGAGPVPLEPSGIVMAAPLVFRWQASNPHPPYRIVVATQDKEPVYEAASDAAEFVLPADVQLSPGRPLLWRVEDASAGGQSAGRWLGFIIATPQARALAAQLDRAIPNPSPAERNLREALIMQQMTED